MRRALPNLSIVAACTLLLPGCKPPPDAPTELAQLADYLFHEMGQPEEDEEYLVAGLENLDAWLKTDIDATAEGYTVDNLSQDYVAELDIGNPSTDALVGAAVAVRHTYGVMGPAVATAWADQEDVLSGNYDLYEREYFGDKDAFINREDSFLEASSYSESSWAGLVNVDSTNWIQFRWVETEMGWVLMHRSWLIEPAEVSWDAIKVNAQYLLAVTLPAEWNSSGSVRLMTTWIDSEYPLNMEDFARNQMVSSMQKQGEMIEEWLDESVEQHGSVAGIYGDD